MRLTSISDAAQFAPLSSLLLYQLLPSFPSALPGPNHIQATAMSRVIMAALLGAASARSLG